MGGCGVVVVKSSEGMCSLADLKETLLGGPREGDPFNQGARERPRGVLGKDPHSWAARQSFRQFSALLVSVRWGLVANNGQVFVLVHGSEDRGTCNLDPRVCSNEVPYHRPPHSQLLLKGHSHGPFID